MAAKKKATKKSRSAAAKKGARTKAANKKRRSLAAKKGARKARKPSARKARKSPARKRRTRRNPGTKAGAAKRHRNAKGQLTSAKSTAKRVVRAVKKAVRKAKGAAKGVKAHLHILDRKVAHVEHVQSAQQKQINHLDRGLGIARDKLGLSSGPDKAANRFKREMARAAGVRANPRKKSRRARRRSHR